MIQQTHEALPDWTIRVAADGQYATGIVVKAAAGASSNLVSRIRSDAAIYALPPKRRPHRRGPPRKKGKRLPTPKKLARRKKGWRTVEALVYGERAKRRILPIVCLWYHVSKDRPIKLLGLITPSDDKYLRLKASWGGFAGYDRWFAGKPNNATLASVALYTELVRRSRSSPAREDWLRIAHAYIRIEDAHARVTVFDTAGTRITDVPLPTLGTVSGIAGRADSPEMSDTVKVQDHTLRRLVDFLNERVGRGRWVMAVAADHGTQRDPEEGKPASESTEIRVLYDDQALYFGCLFHDSDPSGIVARLMRRDDEGDRKSVG
jgi:hypothetical protein